MSFIRTNRWLVVALMTVTPLLYLDAKPKVKAKKLVLAANIDPLVHLPEAYGKSPSDLDTIFDKGKYKTNPYYKWLTNKKDRAILKRHLSDQLKIDLTMLDGAVPIQEVVVDFEDDKFLGITISVFNRGDGGKISKEEFDRVNSTIFKHVSKQLDTKPTEKKGNVKRGIMTSGYIWSSPRGKAILEYNIEAPNKIEFIRLRMATKKSKGLYEAAIKLESQATVRRSSLPRNVVKKDGAVYIENIPMVDQGAKGYCVVASAQRLFEYYGIACDMHQLAQLANSDPDKGTNTMTINNELGAIDYLFKTRFSCEAVGHGNSLVKLKDNKYVGSKISESSFFNTIRRNIDTGYPLLWSLDLGQAAEEPNLNPQTSGGHMRMIIGYDDKKGKIIFSDSWGAGHEYKTMNASDVYGVTKGLFLLKPTID